MLKLVPANNSHLKVNCSIKTEITTSGSVRNSLNSLSIPKKSNCFSGASPVAFAKQSSDIIISHTLHLGHLYLELNLF